MIRHLLGISGGKDSAALAVYLKDKIDDMEYVFCDTGKELKETYEYIDILEAYLNKHITRLPKELPGFSDKYDFDHFLELYGHFLPSARVRWCTKDLKLKPFEHYIGTEDTVYNYVGIRSDEQRLGYISTRSNVQSIFPFVENNIDKEGVLRILEESGLGLPKYYEWRTRSGCYFCFYQSKKEWLGLKKHHPDLFELAKGYEKDEFTWREDISLVELEKISDSSLNDNGSSNKVRSPLLADILDDGKEDMNYEKPCLICHL